MAVRVAALLVPAALSFLAALGSGRVFDHLVPGAPWIAGAAVSLVAAMVTLVVGERIGRRFLPLAMLLKLALLFPDQVPSRLSISLRAASPRRLARKLASADPSEAHAAEHVLALVSALSAHDRLTRGHSERVRAVAMLIADEMKITGADRDKLEWAALLHDVGKIHVSPAILNKKGRPNDEEWAELRKHPGKGAPLAGELAEWMGDWVHAIDQHHERFDGTGYPKGLHGDEITAGARIVSAADAFEVMTAVRSYKQAMPVAEARAELAACQGTHFDPVVVRAFAALSVAKLHRALGPASWALSLPLRGATTQAIRAAGSLVGGTAPTALAGLSAAFVMSLTTTTTADLVDGRFGEREPTTIVETAYAGAADPNEAGAASNDAEQADADAGAVEPVGTAAAAPTPTGGPGSAPGDTADARDSDEEDTNHDAPDDSIDPAEPTEPTEPTDVVTLGLGEPVDTAVTTGRSTADAVPIDLAGVDLPVVDDLAEVVDETADAVLDSATVTVNDLADTAAHLIDETVPLDEITGELLDDAGLDELTGVVPLPTRQPVVDTVVDGPETILGGSAPTATPTPAPTTQPAPTPTAAPSPTATPDDGLVDDVLDGVGGLLGG